MAHGHPAERVRRGGGVAGWDPVVLGRDHLVMGCPVNAPIDGASGDATETGWLSAEIGATGYRTEIRSAGHTLVADEPPPDGGNNEGPSPYDLLVGALGACTAMTLRMYADKKRWPLEGVTVRLRNSRSHPADCTDCATKPVGIRRLDRTIELRGRLSAEQREQLLRVADRCPVKQSLEGKIQIVPIEPEVLSSSRSPHANEPSEDGALLARIQLLLDEEKRLQAGGTHSQFRAVGEELDRSWDLLRQRRTLAALGLPPDQAEPRPADEIDSIRRQ